MRSVLPRWFLGFQISHLILASTVLAIAVFSYGVRANENELQTATDELAQIEKLVKQLGHDKYVLREQAQDELTRIGAPSLDALASALVSNDVEIVMRAHYLLSAIKVDWVRDTDPSKIQRQLENYGRKKAAERLKIIETLGESAGTPDAGEPEIAALCRIVRYEKSIPLSKIAAIKILDLNGDEQTWANRKVQIDSHLGGSKRQAALWVRKILVHHEDINATIDQWKILAKEEQLLWQKASDQTNHDIIQKVLFHLIYLLEIAGREDEVEPYLEQIVEIQPDNKEGIRKLVTLLLDKKAPHAIETIGNKFSDLFKSDPFLLYPLAYAKQSLGKSKEATALTDIAQKMNSENAVEHLKVARVLLENRGWFDWAEEEYRTVIKIDDSSDSTVRAVLFMSEMLHDQRQDNKATDVLLDFVVAMDGNKELSNIVVRMGRNPNSIHSRMHFFRASAYELQGQVDKQLEQLQLAVKKDPTDADVLIALYRASDQTNEQREDTREKIREALDAFQEEIQQLREQIANNPGALQIKEVLANVYNQFAWLAGNTLGEIDAQLAEQAIRYSHKSLDIRPDAAGYLDTLGRCYYAKGDYKNAIKYQTEANHLAPHSGLIRRQLEMFQQALEKSKKDRDS
jgi:tetratricopeptide (TPR) repeat protein